MLRAPVAGCHGGIKQEELLQFEQLHQCRPAQQLQQRKPVYA